MIMLPYYPKSMAHDPIVKLREQILKNGQFALLDNDEDRIKFTADGLISNELELEGYPNDMKSSAASEKYRKEGNRAFVSNSSTSTALESVLELYSKSITYALPGSRELSLGYANRSAVLFKAHRYEECLLDIDRAFYVGYPDDLKPKLLIRKAKSIYRLTGNMNTEISNALVEARSLIEKLPPKDKRRQTIEDTLNNPEKISSIGKFIKEDSWPDYVPQLEKENSKLPGASEAIKLKFSEDHGVHVVATRDIKSGEVLMLQKPYITVVASESWYDLCAHCGTQNWNGIPCNHCVSVLYCSEECKQAAWSEYHDIECQIQGRLKVLNHHSVIGLRLTLKALREIGSFENLKQRLKGLDSLRGPESQLDIPFDPTSYSTIYTMLDNANNKPPEKLLHWSSNAVEITYFLATRTEIFGQKFTRDLKVVRDVQWFTFVAALMSKNMRIAKTRAIEVSANNEKGNKVDKIAALIPVYSFLNHSCCSPVTLYPFPEAMAVITPIPIKAGDQIFTSYGLHFTKMGRKSRMQMLKTEYHFVCDCPACKHDWSSSTCTSYKDQNLPLEIQSKVDESNKILATYCHEIVNNKNLVVKGFAKEICALVTVLHPHVRHPCSEVETLVERIDDLFHSFSRSYASLDASCEV